MAAKVGDIVEITPGSLGSLIGLRCRVENVIDALYGEARVCLLPL